MTDEQLLKDSDTALIIMRYMSVIKIKANLMRNSRIEAEDLVSEGLIGLLNAIRSYSAEKGSFSAFANVCIANRMKTAVAKSASSQTLYLPESFNFEDIEDGKPSAEELIIRHEQNNEIIECIERVLSPLERDVFFLYLSSFSYSQISEKLSVSQKAVDNALSRAKSKLKVFFIKQES